MKLITFDNYEIKIADEAYLIKPIRDLYRADRSVKKERFFTTMSILYFYADPRSSYSYITDDTQRLNAIKEQEGLPSSFRLDDKMKSLIALYKKLTTTTSLLLLEDTRIAIDKIRAFLRDIDLNAKNERTGMPLYSVSTITTTIARIPELIKDLNEAEKVVAKEIEESGRTRGTVTKKVFEDGF